MVNYEETGEDDEDEDDNEPERQNSRPEWPQFVPEFVSDDEHQNETSVKSGTRILEIIFTSSYDE